MAQHIAAQQLSELTYERQDMQDLSINLKTLARNCPLTQTSSTRSAKDSHLQTLGLFDNLPLEILQNILQQLDLHTLTLMQSLNRTAKLLVHSLPQYRDIVAHAPNALRAMLSTGMASYYSIDDLYGSLRSQECFLCGSFGPLLYLLSCSRCCWRCLAEASDALPVSRESAILSFGLPSSAVLQFPCMRSLPGRYSLDFFDGDTHKRRLALINSKAAEEAGIKLHGSKEAMEAYEADPHGVPRFPRAIILPRSAGNRNVTSLRGRWQMMSTSRKCTRGPLWSEHARYEPRRFMAAIRFPTVDSSNGTIEWGLSCKGCRDGPPNDDASRDWEIMYTQSGFLAHFDQCKWSKHLLASLKTDGSTTLEAS